MGEAIAEISRKGFGCVAIAGVDGRLAGIVTDGDLRRNIATDLLSMSVDQVMTRSPKTVEPGTLAATALELVNSSAITTLVVVEDGRPVGIVHMHDLLRIGVA
jgi:arabinose-5-phosphate isomerase